MKAHHCLLFLNWQPPVSLHSSTDSEALRLGHKLELQVNAILQISIVSYFSSAYSSWNSQENSHVTGNFTLESFPLRLFDAAPSQHRAAEQ